MVAPFAGFPMGFIGSMPVTGPTSLLVFQRGMLARYRDGWAIGLGGGLVGGTYCAIAVHGFSILRDSFTFFSPLAKGLGFLLLFALGLYFIFVQQENPPESPVARPSATSWVGQFFVGVIVAALNPTLLLTWSASVAMLFPMINLTLHAHDRIGFAASVVLGIVAWFSILLALLRRFRGRFPFRVFQRVIRGIGVGLIAISIVSAARMTFTLALNRYSPIHAISNEWLLP